MNSDQNPTAVRNLQTYLRQLSYGDNPISPPPIDGIFDTATRQSLCEFQTMYGLPVTGKANRETWELLFHEYQASIASNALPRPICVFPPFPKNDRLSIGRKGFDVASVQYILCEMETHFQLPQPEITGVYDQTTADAVRVFQQVHGLAPNGEVDRITWDLLANSHNVLFCGYPVQ